MLPLLLLRPFRCLECDRRHFSLFFSRKLSFMGERRLHPRALLNLPLRVKAIAGHVQPEPLQVRTGDVSEGGIRFLAPWWLGPGTPIEIEIDLLDPASGRPHRRAAAARIVRVEACETPGEYELAAAFEDGPLDGEKKP